MDLLFILIILKLIIHNLHEGFQKCEHIRKQLIGTGIPVYMGKLLQLLFFGFNHVFINFADLPAKLLNIILYFIKIIKPGCSAFENTFQHFNRFFCPLCSKHLNKLNHCIFVRFRFQCLLKPLSFKITDYRIFVFRIFHHRNLCPKGFFSCLKALLISFFQFRYSNVPPAYSCISAAQFFAHKHFFIGFLQNIKLAVLNIIQVNVRVVIVRFFLRIVHTENIIFLAEAFPISAD